MVVTHLCFYVHMFVAFYLYLSYFTVHIKQNFLKHFCSSLSTNIIFYFKFVFLQLILLGTETYQLFGYCESFGKYEIWLWVTYHPLPHCGTQTDCALPGIWMWISTTTNCSTRWKCRIKKCEILSISWQLVLFTNFISNNLFWQDIGYWIILYFKVCHLVSLVIVYGVHKCLAVVPYVLSETLEVLIPLSNTCCIPTFLAINTLYIIWCASYA